ncbi:MAG TPA: geranylgeranylglyceryl/heptaprenylglyceryl phosphate synthase [Candidatus Nitrosotalea sp.]|nr:geranylgeranylglyceryl/heptaprenylglyceryl phosphate synthase [Nitrososphaerota archaeon]HKU33320.1 geranylgeranylglyceryl/heptaprenylglyceryl phosphate synthase [Candidatus Nitrosotalea sp.]
MQNVENYLTTSRKNKGALLFVLIDSENNGTQSASTLAKEAEKNGASVILVGGSSATDQMTMADTVKDIKKSVKIPVILFPGNVTGVVPGADAILFSSLLNSDNPYFISQAQALGAPNVLKFRLEPLPTAYIIIGEGTTVWHVGSARTIPFDKPSLAAMYALSAQFMGMRFVYLEAGSGAKSNVRPEMVAAVRKLFKGFLIVGGGIKNAQTAAAIVKAGADAIVIGTFIEKGGSFKTIADIVKTIQSVRK